MRGAFGERGCSQHPHHPGAPWLPTVCLLLLSLGLPRRLHETPALRTDIIQESTVVWPGAACWEPPAQHAGPTGPCHRHFPCRLRAAGAHTVAAVAGPPGQAQAGALPGLELRCRAAAARTLPAWLSVLIISRSAPGGSRWPQARVRLLSSDSGVRTSGALLAQRCSQEVFLQDPTFWASMPFPGHLRTKDFPGLQGALLRSGQSGGRAG